MGSCANGTEQGGDATAWMERLSARAEAAAIPMRGLIELTYRCNLRCVHCYCTEGGRPLGGYAGREELTLDEWKSALDQTADAGCLELTVSGGEILVRRDWHAIVDHAVRDRFAVTLFTAGTLVNETIADRIAGLGVAAVELSVHAMDRAVFEGITGIPGSFDRLLRAIELLRARGVPLLLKAVLMRQNADAYAAIAAFASSVGARVRFGVELSPRNDGGRGPLAFRMTPEQMTAYYRSEVPAAWPHIERETPEAMRRKELCGAGKTGFSINPYGDVLACNQLLIPMGNLRRNTFREIWWTDACDALRLLRATKTFGDLPECADCAQNHVCTRCHGIAHLETGDFRAASRSACEMAAFHETINDACAPAPAVRPVPVTWEPAPAPAAFAV